MCGRFTIDISLELLTELFGLADLSRPEARYNVAPTQKVPVVRELEAGERRLDYLQWGLVPSWAKDRSIGSKMINARSETVAEKPAFRQALKFRRCLVPVSGFYEWKQEGKGTHPLYISLRDNSPMILAGLWERWRSPEGEVVETFTILTTAANPLIEPFHHRMPVILDATHRDTWLDRNLTDPAVLQHLFQPYPASLMRLWPISPLVNSVKNDSPLLLDPLDATSAQDSLPLFS